MELSEIIENSLTCNDLLTKATVAKSVKYSGQKISDVLMYQNLVSTLLKLKVETDPEVKRNALDGLIAIVHTDSSFIKSDIASIQEFAQQETQWRKELIEEVDLGPFKHKVDKGLPMRKSAYQLLETMLDRGSADQLNLD